MEEDKKLGPTLDASSDIETVQEISQENDPKVWVFVIIGIVILGLIITGAVFLFTSDASVTSQVRDIFIIFMALESMVIGAALIILIVQLAILTNLLQNEIKPILDTTNETVNTLRGTATFLSDNMVEPVIAMNEYLATVKRFFDLIRPKK
ncbi:MAG: hypothetical protein MUO76_11930 [Anaerolineaceae bacterium]|nr:hypothetical protein [Anaerolineaceae bacterium]